jgi:hypothetical protein
MSKFKEGDGIVRNKNNPNYYAPMGYKTKALKNHRCKLKDGTTIPIVDDNWELAEDTSKPVTVTHEGNVYEIGKRYAFTDSLPLGDDFTVSRLNFIYAPNSDPSYVFDSEGLPYRYAVSLSEVNLDAGTITPAPIDLIDGNAYMFDWSDRPMKGSIGVYSLDSQRFYFVNGHVLASYCTNIRLMTVAESK